MINIKELRLGSYVMYGQTTHVVTAISMTLVETHWSDGTENYIHLPDELDPIPLTEEVLSCLKLDKYLLPDMSESHCITSKEGIYFFIDLMDDGYYLCVEMESFEKIVKIDFLHELQNVIKVLVGKELEYGNR